MILLHLSTNPRWDGLIQSPSYRLRLWENTQVREMWIQLREMRHTLSFSVVEATCELLTQPAFMLVVKTKWAQVWMGFKLSGKGIQDSIIGG